MPTIAAIASGKPKVTDDAATATVETEFKEYANAIAITTA
jgi:hypothetical protein